MDAHWMTQDLAQRVQNAERKIEEDAQRYAHLAALGLVEEPSPAAQSVLARIGGWLRNRKADKPAPARTVPKQVTALVK
jgi:hypothetical protein